MAPNHKSRARSSGIAHCATTDAFVVCARQLDAQIDLLAAYAVADQYEYRSLWMRPSLGFGLLGLGVAVAVEPSGENRFKEASTARAMLKSRLYFFGPDDAPSPVLLGGFSFAHTTTATNWPSKPTYAADGETANSGTSDGETANSGTSDGETANSGTSDGETANSEKGEKNLNTDDSVVDHADQLTWEGFGDCYLVLPKLTVINREGGTWVLASGKLRPGEDKELLRLRLELKLHTFASQPPSAGSDGSGISGTKPVTSSRGARSPSAESDGSGIPRASLRSNSNRYLDLVEQGIDDIKQGECQKIVLARAVNLAVSISDPFSMAAVLDRLRYSDPDCAVFAFDFGGSVFFGATPERLITFQDSKISTAAVAGTVARGTEAVEDAETANTLLESSKILSEHRFVVEDMVDVLTKLGLVDIRIGNPCVLNLPYVKHLNTSIEAEMRSDDNCIASGDLDVVSIAGRLHPTPAVGGTPTEAATRFIATNEGWDRGWYAAPVGWCELQGHGEMWVAIRSGLAGKNQSWLFSGSGVVADSVPVEELQEADDKLKTLLKAIYVFSP